MGLIHILVWLNFKTYTSFQKEDGSQTNLDLKTDWKLIKCSESPLLWQLEPERTSSASDASDQKNNQLTQLKLKRSRSSVLQLLTSYRSGLGSTLTAVQLPRSSRPRSEQRRRDGASAGGAHFGGCAPEAAAWEEPLQRRAQVRGGGGGRLWVAWIGDRIGEWKWVDWLPVGFWRSLVRALSVTDTPTPSPLPPSSVSPFSFPAPIASSPLFRQGRIQFLALGGWTRLHSGENCTSSHPSGAIVDPTPERMKRSRIYDQKNTSHVPLSLNLKSEGVKQPPARWRREERHECKTITQMSPLPFRCFTHVEPPDSGAPAADGLVRVRLSVIDTGEHSLLMRPNAKQWRYLSLIICFQLRHITRSLISALFTSDLQPAVRKLGTRRHKSAQITLNLFLSVLVLLKDFLK